MTVETPESFWLKDKEAMALAAAEKVLGKIPQDQKEEFKAALAVQAATAASETAAPLCIVESGDENLTAELLAIRNVLFLGKYAEKDRRHSLATFPALAFVRAVIGKRILIEHPLINYCYAGTGCYILAGDSGSGKSALIDKAGQLYEYCTGVESYKGTKVTMAHLAHQISTKFDTKSDKTKCRDNPNAFFWTSDEFSGSFGYLIKDFSEGGNGGGDEGRFNLCFDSGSAVDNSSQKSPIKTYDNCNLLLAGVQPTKYARAFNPFSDSKVETGLTGRLSVDWYHSAFDLNPNPDKTEDKALCQTAADRLKGLADERDYYSATVDPGLDLLAMFRSELADFADKEPTITASAAPKRIREALSEAAVLTYLKASTVVTEGGKKQGWSIMDGSHPMLLPFGGSFPIDLDILKKRIRANALMLINHYVISSYLIASYSEYQTEIKRLLAAAPMGMHRQEIIAKIGGSHRNYKIAATSLDALVRNGDVYKVTIPTGRPGRPEVRYVSKDHLTKEMAKTVADAAVIEKSEAREAREIQ